MITVAITSVIAFIVVIALAVRHGKELEEQRDEAYDYILNQWRKGLLRQPPSQSLASHLYQYETEQYQQAEKS